MTDEQIIKALKRYIEESDGFYATDVLKLALDLINRQNDLIYRQSDVISEQKEKIERMYVDAVKEFAERLKEKATDIGVCDAQGNNYGGATVVFVNDVNNITKGLVGDTDV